MANVKTGGLMATKPNTNSVSKPASPIAAMIKAASVQERFEQMLGKKSAGFLSSLLTLVNNNSLLMKADPNTVLAAAAQAAALDLPINQTLGQAWIVPYKGKAQFQISAKGLVQLAIRSGKIKKVVCVEVYEGEISNWNKFLETFDYGEKTSDKVVGYYAYFETVNGYSKGSYWTKDAVLKHAQTYSPSWSNPNSVWHGQEQDKMGCKTVLKDLLKNWAPLSTEMQEAIAKDEETFSLKDDGTIEAEIPFDDMTEEEVPAVDIETGEIIG